MHYLSIGAIFRSENSWLEEWIRYHHAAGVEHFYLFNDDENTHVSDRILRPFVETGLVENIHLHDMDWFSKINQLERMNAAYRKLIKIAVGQTQWLALIDLDEFILPKQTDDIREVMEKYEEHSGLAINWQIFGTSGYIKRPPTQINHLLHRAKTNWLPNRFFRSIVRPELVIPEEIYDVHHLPCKIGRTVDENFEPVAGLTYDITTDVVQINHYVLRSWQDFWEVKAVRPRFNGASPCDEAYFEFHDRNEVFDDEIAKRFGHCINRE